MINNAFKNGIFALINDDSPEGVDREDEDKDKCYTPK